MTPTFAIQDWAALDEARGREQAITPVLYPNREQHEREEKRRWELTTGHWDDVLRELPLERLGGRHIRGMRARGLNLPGQTAALLVSLAAATGARFITSDLLHKSLAPADSARCWCAWLQ